MKKQVSNSLVNRFWKSVSSFLWFLSKKHRKYKTHRVETMSIMNRILEIKKKLPELSMYLNEMPEFPPNENDSEIKLANLKHYHIHLLELLETYELESKKRHWFI